MIIKKYVGRTESEATEEARKELGPNIVVMTVRPAKKTGFFSIFQPQKIEVTVGLEEETERAPRSFSPEKERTVTPKVSADDYSQKDTIIASGGRVTPKHTTVSEVKDDNSAIEEKLDNLSNLLEKNFLKPFNYFL